MDETTEPNPRCVTDRRQWLLQRLQDLYYVCYLLIGDGGEPDAYFTDEIDALHRELFPNRPTPKKPDPPKTPPSVGTSPGWDLQRMFDEERRKRNTGMRPPSCPPSDRWHGPYLLPGKYAA
jgi:hypothetical protein